MPIIVSNVYLKKNIHKKCRFIFTAFFDHIYQEIYIFGHVCMYVCVCIYIYIYIYIYISAVKRLIAINCIQNKKNSLHRKCVCNVYIYYVYINTHPCMYMFNKNMLCLYIKYIYIYNINYMNINIYM